MPELPELEALGRYLDAQARGAVVSKVRIVSFSVLKTVDPSPDALVGRPLTATGRVGKFLWLDHDGIYLVLHLARAGWVRWKDDIPKAPPRPGKGPLHLRVVYETGVGFDVTEAGTEKGAAAYVVRDPTDIEHVATLGIDPLDRGFTAERLHQILQEAGGTQIKGALTDQRRVAGVGNAYSDEALHAAGLSPFKPSNKLTATEADRLHEALVGGLRDAVERSVGLAASDLKDDKKDHLRVHGRTGLPCPTCGDTVREVSFASKSLQYCPTCQTGGKPLADRRMSRLLK